MSVIVWSRPVKSKPYSNVFQSAENELLAKAQAVHPLLRLLDDFVCVGTAPTEVSISEHIQLKIVLITPQGQLFNPTSVWRVISHVICTFHDFDLQVFSDAVVCVEGEDTTLEATTADFSRCWMWFSSASSTAFAVCVSGSNTGL